MSASQTVTGRGHGEMGNPPERAALSLRGIYKSFVGVRALADVNLDVTPGEVHALVGENGAGKSTLMAVASGALQADRGRVEIDGNRLPSASPEAARELGLGIVRQDPALLPDLTVAENMAIGVGYERVGGIRKAASWTTEKLAIWEMGIDPKSRVSDLSVEQRFVVEIAKALALDPKVLILDEPTEHLSLEEVQRLFTQVRSLTAAGAAVVYISHRIPEVLQIADRVTVLRDGQTRGTFRADDVDEHRIVALVIGRSLDAVFSIKGSIAGTVTETEQLRVRGFSGQNFADVDLTVRAGEIVGLAGVQGNGQSSLIRALAGLGKATGDVSVAGQKLRLGSSAAAVKQGIVYVPSDRHDEGVFLPLSVADNIVVTTLGQVASAGLVKQHRVTARALEQVKKFRIKTPTTTTPVKSLSGGNQQKVVMARTLLSNPAVLLAEEPTQGVDAGARVDIYQTIRDVADRGAAVLVLSSDGVELQGLCDRVLIVSRGAVVEELVGTDVTEEGITRAALTSTTVRSRVKSKAERLGWLGQWLRGDQSPAAVLALAFLLLALAVSLTSSSYLSAFNLNNLLFAAAPLILVGAAQHLVVLGAGIDLSVGPLMGLLVVIASFHITADGNPVIGLVLMLLVALVVGLLNGYIVTYLEVDPVVTTLVTFMAMQGLFLTWRSVPGGVIDPNITTQMTARLGFVPIATVIATVLALVLEVALRRTRWGLNLRGLGSRREAAEKLGIRTRRVQLLSYVLCSLLAFPAALLVMAQIGTGDGRPSVGYTLSSITIVVLAGASVFGGRGSFIGVLAASLLVQQLLSASPFLGLSQAWAYLLPGLIIIGAAVLFATLRRTRRS